MSKANVRNQKFYTEKELMLNNEDATFIPFQVEFSNFPGVVNSSNIFDAIESRIIDVALPQKSVNIQNTLFNGQVQKHVVDSQDEQEQRILLTLLCDRMFVNYIAWENWRKMMKREKTLGPEFLKDNKIHNLRVWFLDSQQRKTFAFDYTDCLIEIISAITLQRFETIRPTFQISLRFTNDELVVGDGRFFTTNGFEIVDSVINDGGIK